MVESLARVTTPGEVHSWASRLAEKHRAVLLERGVVYVPKEDYPKWLPRLDVKKPLGGIIVSKAKDTIKVQVFWASGFAGVCILRVVDPKEQVNSDPKSEYVVKWAPGIYVLHNTRG